MTGKSGLSVNVRSTTRTAPDATAPAKSKRLLLSTLVLPLSPVRRLRAELTFDGFGIGREALANLLGDIADEHVLKPALERRHDRIGDRARRDLRRRHGLEPFGVERPGEQIDHLHAARPQLCPQAMRQRQAG